MKIYKGVEVENPSLAELEKLLAEKKRVYSLHEGRYQLIVSIYVVSGVKYAKTGKGDYHAITKIVWYL